MRIGGGTYHRQAQEAQALLLLQGTCCSKSGGPLPKADHLPDLLSPLACGVSTAWQWSRQSSRSPLSGGGVGAEAPPFSSFQFTLLQGTLLLASCQQPCYSCFLVNKVFTHPILPCSQVAEAAWDSRTGALPAPIAQYRVCRWRRAWTHSWPWASTMATSPGAQGLIPCRLHLTGQSASPPKMSSFSKAT
jgi:hypothetical protein